MAKKSYFNVAQCSSVLNLALNQAFGIDPIETLDARGLFSLGEVVLDSDENKNTFIEALSNIIYRTVVRTLDNSVEIPNILVNGSDYLGALRKISIKPMRPKDDSSYDLSTNTMWRITKAEATEKIFGTCQPFVIELTIPDKLLEPAFNGTREADDFVIAMFDMITKSTVEIANALTKLAISNLIAEKIKSNKGVVHLLTMYNTETEQATPLTKGKARFNRDFIAYATMIFENYFAYMSKTSILFNDGSIERATQRDNMHVMILSDFANSQKVFLEADTYNRSLVRLPMYEEVVAWQGFGDTLPTFESNSSINIIPSSEEDEETPTEVEQSDIIGIFADREAVACSLYEDWSASDRNNRQRYTNYTFGANRGFYNDLSENCVIFLLD